MLSEPGAIHSLEQALASALASLHIPTTEFGRPTIVEKAAQQAESAFQSVGTTHPSKQDAHVAVLAFVGGQSLSEQQYHLAASALCEPFPELQGARAVGHSRFENLIEQYEKRAKSGELWRLTWYGLLASYFSFDFGKASQNERVGWIKLRDMLQRTWPDIDRESGTRTVPAWIKVMRRESQLLTEAPTDKYSADYLAGHTDRVTQLVEELGIPQSSWFWHSLVLAVVRTVCDFKDDAEFKKRIPRVLELLNARPVFRDEALEYILTRYHQSSSTEVHPELRDFVVHKDVWRNPKLKAAGLATAWNRVPEPVWRMVLSWVNEASLKLFFQLLAGRSGSDEGRLEFWSRYLDQITWTRLIFGSETMALARNNQEIRNLIAQEERAYATLTGKQDVDAFMMQIGDYLVVEFSKTGHACNVYRARQLQFDPQAQRYSGGTDDLRYGYRGGAAVRITHNKGWEVWAGAKLKDIGIHPDVNAPKKIQEVLWSQSNRILSNKGCEEPADAGPKGKRSYPEANIPEHKPAAACSVANGTALTLPRSTVTTTVLGSNLAPKYARFTMNGLRVLVSGNYRASINDSRGASGGRLWVEYAQQHGPLAMTLRSWGFRWSDSRSAWYFPED